MQAISIEQLTPWVIAIVGWCVVGVQALVKRNWQKTDRLKEQRYVAYRGLMDKLDSIAVTMKTDPSSSVFALTKEFINTIASGEVIEPNTVIGNFGTKLIAQVQQSCAPLQTINDEINSIKLIASKHLLEKLCELQELNTDLYNEMMSCLATISGPQLDEFKKLESVGRNERWKRFTSLHEEITQLMRREIGVE